MEELDFEEGMKRKLKEVMMMVMLEAEIGVMDRCCGGESEDGDDGEGNRRGGGEDGGFVAVVVILLKMVKLSPE